MVGIVMAAPAVVPELSIGMMVVAGASVTALGESGSEVARVIDFGGQVTKFAGRLLALPTRAMMVEAPGCLAVAKPLASIVTTLVLVEVQPGVPTVEVMSTPAEFSALIESCVVIASEVQV